MTYELGPLDSQPKLTKKRTTKAHSKGYSYRIYYDKQKTTGSLVEINVTSPKKLGQYALNCLVRHAKDSSTWEEIIENSNKRTPLNSIFEMIERSQPSLQKERNLAKTRMVKIGSKYGRGKFKSGAPIGTKVRAIRAVDIVAEELGISPRVYYRGLELMQKTNEDTKMKLRSGELTINRAYTDLKEKEQRELDLKEKELRERQNILIPPALITA